MRLRSLLRVLHFLAAASLGTLVYSPWIQVQAFVLFNQVVVIPVLALSGMWMWQGHRLRAHFSNRKGERG